MSLLTVLLIGLWARMFCGDRREGGGKSVHTFVEIKACSRDVLLRRATKI